MNILINDEWLYAIEITDRENTIGVEIPNENGHDIKFNEIFDKAHRTHGMSVLLNIPYAALLQENNGKGKSTSKCKVGTYTNCMLEQIVPNYFNDLSYGFFKYENKITNK